MRLLAPLSLLLLALQQNVVLGAEGGLYPPGLQPLITRANVLLSAGQFGEAAKVYSEAIEQSPADYLLYYKRATAYFSMQRHGAALEDFNKVLSLTSNTFDNAHLMKAKIHLREGDFPSASQSLHSYLKAKKQVKDKDVEELEGEIAEGQKMRSKTEQERKAGLWNACVDSAGSALRVASHSPEIRAWRAECALASGDIESSVADLSRLSGILPPSTTLLSTVSKLSYFLTPPSAATMNTLKQCLHYDPDSKTCLKLHRLVKGLDKSFKSLDGLLEKEDWKGIVRLLLTPGQGKNGDLYQRYEDAMKTNLGKPDEVLPLVPTALLHPATPSASSSTSHKKRQKGFAAVTFPDLDKSSPLRQTLVRSLCKSFIHLGDIAKSSEEYKKQRKRWCEDLLTLKGCEKDIDGLVGKGETLLAEQEYEESMRVFNEAFEASGRSDAKIQNRLHKAHKLLKQSKQKDYYKIVGVSKDADEKTIKKAYRKAAKLAHPDKGGSEAKMAALNEAYEVLSNPELRARFDAGEDPMDPQSQQGGGNPFGGFGGFPGGGFPGGGGAGGHPFAQFFQGGGFGQGGGGQQWHFSHGH